MCIKQQKNLMGFMYIFIYYWKTRSLVFFFVNATYIKKEKKSAFVSWFPFFNKHCVLIEIVFWNVVKKIQQQVKNIRMKALRKFEGVTINKKNGENRIFNSWVTIHINKKQAVTCNSLQLFILSACGNNDVTSYLFL